MCFILGIGELIPKFGPILSLIGGSTITALTFVFPCLFYLRIERNIPLHIKVFLYELIAVGIFGGVARPFSIVLVKLAFNANRNSRKKPKKC